MDAPLSAAGGEELSATVGGAAEKPERAAAARAKTIESEPSRSLNACKFVPCACCGAENDYGDRVCFWRGSQAGEGPARGSKAPRGGGAIAAICDRVTRSSGRRRCSCIAAGADGRGAAIHMAALPDAQPLLASTIGRDGGGWGVGKGKPACVEILKGEVVCRPPEGAACPSAAKSGKGAGARGAVEGLAAVTVVAGEGDGRSVTERRVVHCGGDGEGVGRPAGGHGAVAAREGAYKGSFPWLSDYECGLLEAYAHRSSVHAVLLAGFKGAHLGEG